MIEVLDKTHVKTLEEFLVTVFGEKFRTLAQRHIQAMFSDDLSRLCFLLCWRDDKIIGAAAISEAVFTTDTWGIGWVGVHPDFRRNGIGTAVVKACLAEIAKRIQKTSTALLSVYPALTGFYERLGFCGTTTDQAGSPYLSCVVVPDCSAQ